MRLKNTFPESNGKRFLFTQQPKENTGSHITPEKQLGFNYKSLLSNREDCYTMLKGQTHQKCAVIVNISAPDIRAGKMQRMEQQR